MTFGFLLFCFSGFAFVCACIYLWTRRKECCILFVVFFVLSSLEPVEISKLIVPKFPVTPVPSLLNHPHLNKKERRKVLPVP